MHRLLVCFGNAEFGRLGLGHGLQSAVAVPRVCLALAKYDLQAVAAGGAHTAVVTRGGLLFTFGLNSSGQLGHSPGAHSVADPGNVLLPEPVTAVATGDAHTLCLTESGQVWAFGSNARGQLGLGPHVAAEEAAFAAGGVWASGGRNGEQDGGQARRPHAVWRPRLVEALTGQRVVSVAAGGAHSLAVTEDGGLWAWGAGDRGQLGLGREWWEAARQAGQEQEAEQRSREDDDPGAGSSSTCGAVAWLPQRLLLPPAHAAAAAARGGPAAADASPHAAAVFAGLASSACTDASGHVYTWGLGGTHQLGHGGPHDEWSPRLVDVPSLRRIRKVSLGACHAMAARADERVHVWGSDRAASGCLGGAHLGAIGGGATTTAGGVGGGTAAGPGAGAGAGPQQPLVMSRPAMFRYWFTDVACGFAHSAGISSDGRLYTWGWGGTLGGADSPPQLEEPEYDTSEGGGGGSAARDKSTAAEAEARRRLREARGRLRLGGGQLGVGGGVDLPLPTLVTKLEVLPGEVLRQDGGDPFNYQDNNLGWVFRSVAAGHNHTAAIIQVSRAWTGALAARSRERRAPRLEGQRQGSAPEGEVG